MSKKRQAPPKPIGPSGVVRRMREQRDYAWWYLKYEIGLSLEQIERAYRLAGGSAILVALRREQKRRKEEGKIQYRVAKEKLDVPKPWWDRRGRL